MAFNLAAELFAPQELGLQVHAGSSQRANLAVAKLDFANRFWPL